MALALDDAFETFIREVEAQGLHNVPMTGWSEQGTDCVQEPVPDQELDHMEDFDEEDLACLNELFSEEGMDTNFDITDLDINNFDFNNIGEILPPTATAMPISNMCTSHETLPHYPPIAPDMREYAGLPGLSTLSTLSALPALPALPSLSTLSTLPAGIATTINGTSTSPDTIYPHTRSHYRLIAPTSNDKNRLIAPTSNDKNRCCKKKSSVKRRFNGKPGADRKFFVGRYVVAALRNKNGTISLQAWKIDRTESQEGKDHRYPDKIVFTAYTFDDDKNVFSEVPSDNGIEESSFDTSNAEGTILNACDYLTSDHKFKKTHLLPAHKKLNKSGAIHNRAFGPSSTCEYCNADASKAV
jgi:hypothetical protein